MTARAEASLPVAVVPALSWRPALLACAVAIVVLVWMFFSTFAAMVSVWSRSDTFAHGYLVAPISLWLVWRLKDQLRPLLPAPTPKWLVAVGACAALWLVGDVAGVNAMTQLAAVAMLIAALVAVLGVGVARAVMFPLVFLLFMVPIGDFLLPVLMARTADVTVWFIKAIGIPVYRDGLQFVIPSGSWSVVEACSGVRYLIASFMVGSLFAYLNYSSPKRRALFIVVSLIVPVVANWGRAILIVMLGHFSGNTLAVGADHLIYGWVFFGIVVMMMFAIGARWSQVDPQQLDAPAPTPTHVVPIAPRTAAWVGLVACVLLIAALPRAMSSHLRTPSDVGPVLLSAPELKGLSGATAPVDYRPVFERASATWEQTYAMGPAVVSLHVAYYRQQGPGHKLVASTNTMVRSDDTAWHRTSSKEHLMAVGDTTLAVRGAEIRAGSVTGAASELPRVHARQLLWVDGQFTASDAQAVWQGLRGQLASRGDDAAAVTWFVHSADTAAADAALAAFSKTQMADIARWLEQVRARR
jgi:exosortase A